MSIEKHKAFFKSLDNEKMLPESFYRLLIPEIDRYQHGDEALSLSTNYWYPVDELWIGEHVLPKVVSRRAESRQIPDLKEKVKELMRDAMEVTRNRYKDCVGLGKTYADYEDFVELCESDKGQEVKP